MPLTPADSLIPEPTPENQVTSIDTNKTAPAAAGQTGSAVRLGQRGEPIIRAAPMPSDVNANGDIFGGWVLSQMDIAGGILASERARGRVATVAVNAMTFHQPIRVGDLVSIYGRVERVGRTSLTIVLETVVMRRQEPGEIRVTEGSFVYVAIDETGKPRPLGPDIAGR